MTEELKIKISAEMEKFVQAVQDVVKALQDIEKAVSGADKEVEQTLKKTEKKTKSFKDTVKKHLEGAGESFQKIGDFATEGLKKVGTAIAGAATALLAVGPATAEYRTEQAKLVSAFETAGSSAEAAKSTYNDLYRVLGESDRAVEAANHIAKLTQNEKEMEQWTKICQGVYATFGDSLPIEGLTEAANETAKVGQITGSLADALNWAGISEDAFNEKLAACATEQEREALIRETLNGLYDEAATRYEENNAAVLKQNEANAKFQETMAAIGDAMAPVNTLLTQLGTEILTMLEPYIRQFAEEILPVIQEKLDEITPIIEKVINFIMDNWETIAKIAGVLLGIAAAISVVSTAVGILNALFALNPVVLAILAIIAVITTCIVFWDEICAVVEKVWNFMGELISSVVGWIVDIITGLVNGVVNTIGRLVSILTELFQLLITNVKGKIAQMKQNITETFSNIYNTMKSKIDSAKQTVLNIFDNIKSGIKSKIDGAKQFVHDAIEKIKSFFKFEWSLPKLKLPHVSISGEFSLMPPRVPHFSIDWYARGGVFDKPMLFPYGGSIGGLGEDGAEAVVPLEKNTQWLDKIAEKLTEKSGATPVILQVDGKTFAQTSIATINSLTRQTGKLELNVY